MPATNESGADRFQRVAEMRTNKIINMIRLLGNCSNRSAYDYADEDVKKIFSAIETELRSAKSRFTAPEVKQTKFRLRENDG